MAHFVLAYFILFFERICDLLFGNIERDTESTEEKSEYDQLSVSHTHTVSLLSHNLSWILNLISQYLCLVCSVSLISV